MSENPKFIPTDRVSKKLKIVVIMLTVLIFLAFIALFNKFSNKQPIKNVPAVQEPLSNQHLVDEYQRVGTRLMNSGLKEQAIDQFIRVWEMQKFDGVEKAKAARTVGRLYADLGNCPEALVWLFRAEVLDPEKILTPLIDACLAKVRNNISGQ